MASPAATPLKRRSCDRCHSKKLRCPRLGQSDRDGCSRCLRMGIRCVYSAPHPRGRPSAHRRAGGTILPLETADSPYPPIVPSVSTSDSSADIAPVCDNSIGPSPDITQAIESDVRAPVWNSGSSELSLPDDTTFFQPSIQLDWNLPSNAWSDLINSSTLSLLADLPTTTCTGAVDTEGGADVCRDSANTFTSTPSCTTFSIPGLSPPILPYFNHIPSLPSSTVDETEKCIKELSDLSVRLYPVYKMSCEIIEGRPKYQGTVLSAAAFDAIQVLIQGPRRAKPPVGRCNFFHEVFSTSSSLLDIIDRLHATTGTCTNSANTSQQNHTISSLTPTSSTFGSAGGSDNSINTSKTIPTSSVLSSSPKPASAPSNDFLEGGSIPVDKQPPNSNSRSKTPLLANSGANDSHNISVCYQILACYSRILHIYSTVARVLHYDASNVKVFESRSRPWMVEMRISLLLQFVVLLFDRLQQAMKAYFLEVENRLDTARAATHMPRPSLSYLNRNLVGLGNITELESEVRERLKQLQAALHG